MEASQNKMKLNRPTRLAKLMSLAIVIPFFAASPAHAVDCNPITGTTLSQTSDLWIFEWDALTDTTDVNYLLIFATSGSGSQDWYNNVDGYQWDSPLPSTQTAYLNNKNGLIYRMNELGIAEVTFSIRKDNINTCYPISTIGTITPSRLSSPSNIQITQNSYDKISVTFDSHPMTAANTVTITPTSGGAPRIISEYEPGAEISDLQASTSYTISIKSLGGIANIDSLSEEIVFTTPQDPVEVARLAYLAKQAEIAKAKADIQESVTTASGLTLDVLAKAEIKGATKTNLPLINEELAQLSPGKRGNIQEILKVIRKFEVVDILASADTNKIQSNLLVEINLIPSDSKNKTTLVTAIRKLSPSNRSTYQAIESVIKLEMQSIQNRKDRLAAVIKRMNTKG